MRVTRTIKDYITKRVTEAYQPKINEIDLQYRCDRENLTAKIKSAVAECEEKIRAIVADSGDGWNYEPCLYGSKGDKYLYFYDPRDRDAEKKFREMEHKLAEEKREKIEEIIVALELGGNKETLDEMLKNL